MLSLWAWVLVALCAAGALVLLCGALTAALALRSTVLRLTALRQSQVVRTLEHAPLVAERLAHTAAQARPLPARLQAAITQISGVRATVDTEQIAATYAGFTAGLRALIQALR